jgi:hypothetical protein
MKYLLDTDMVVYYMRSIPSVMRKLEATQPLSTLWRSSFYYLISPVAIVSALNGLYTRPSIMSFR